VQEGNVCFRSYVAPLRTEYNLAKRKEDKVTLCQHVIDHVTAQGGTFLQKESGSSQFWIELDHERVMAKCSQALREGAPRIRAELGTSATTTTGNRKKKNSSNDNSNSSTKRHRTATVRRNLVKEEDEEGHEQRDDVPSFVEKEQEDETEIGQVGAVGNGILGSITLGKRARLGVEPDDRIRMPAPLPFLTPNESLIRTHSLALSDVSLDDDTSLYLSQDFVNPFEDESDILTRRSSSTGSSTSSSLSPLELPPPRVGATREASTASTSTDMAGLGALLTQVENSSSNHSSNGSGGTRQFLNNSNNGSTFSGTSRYAPTQYDNENSTMGLPLWEWLDKADWSLRVPVSP
jgi:hypothetical protein